MADQTSAGTEPTTLEGLTILDFTAHIAGPYGTKTLADLGARVLKVERPEGDPSRRSVPFMDGIPGQNRSALYHFLNANKESIVVDFKNPRSRAVVEKLLGLADLAVFSSPPAVIERLQFDYENISQVSRGSVLYLTNFGFDGPYRNYRASDTTIYGMGAEMFAHGLADREPLKVGGTTALIQAGAMLGVAAMGAIHGFENHGTKQRVDVNLFETHVANMDRRGATITSYRFSGRVAGRVEVAAPGIAGGIYPVADGHVEVTATAGNYWARFVEMIDDDRLRDPKWLDPAFVVRPEAREEVDAIAYPWMLERTRLEVWEAAREAKLLAAPLFTGEDIRDDPVLKERGFWVELETEELGKFPMLGRPYIFERTPWSLRRAAPTLGQDTDKILQLAGFDASEISELRHEGAVQ